MAINPHVQNLYNQIARSEALRTPDAKKRMGEIARVLFKRDLDALAEPELQAVAAAYLSAVSVFGGTGISGFRDGGADYGMIYQGLLNSGGGMIGVKGSSGANYNITGASAEGLALASQIKRVSDTASHGSGGAGSVKAFDAGYYGAESGAQAMAEILRNRGGIRAGDAQQVRLGVDRYGAGGSKTKTNDKLSRGERGGAFLRDDINAVGTFLDTTVKDTMHEEDAAGARRALTLAMVKSAIVAKLRAAHPDKDEETIQADVEYEMDKFMKADSGVQRSNILDKNGALWYLRNGTHYGNTLFDAKSLAAITDKDRPAADQIQKTGEFEVLTLTEDIKNELKQAQKRSAAVIEEMKSLFNTNDMDQLRQLAKSFGSSTLTAENDVKNIRAVLESGKRRAAMTGRTVAEVMTETAHTAQAATAVLGSRNVTAGTIDRIMNAVQDSQVDRDMGYDTRTADQVRAEAITAEAQASTMSNKPMALLKLYRERQQRGQLTGAKKEFFEKWNKKIHSGATLTDDERREFLAKAEAFAMYDLNGWSTDRIAAYADPRDKDAFNQGTYRTGHLSHIGEFMNQQIAASKNDKTTLTGQLVAALNDGDSTGATGEANYKKLGTALATSFSSMDAFQDFVGSEAFKDIRKEQDPAKRKTLADELAKKKLKFGSQAERDQLVSAVMLMTQLSPEELSLVTDAHTGLFADIKDKGNPLAVGSVNRELRMQDELKAAKEVNKQEQQGVFGAKGDLDYKNATANGLLANLIANSGRKDKDGKLFGAADAVQLADDGTLETVNGLAEAAAGYATGTDLMGDGGVNKYLAEQTISIINKEGSGKTLKDVVNSLVKDDAELSESDKLKRGMLVKALGKNSWNEVVDFANDENLTLEDQNRMLADVSKRTFGTVAQIHANTDGEMILANNASGELQKHAEAEAKSRKEGIVKELLGEHANLNDPMANMLLEAADIAGEKDLLQKDETGNPRYAATGEQARLIARAVEADPEFAAKFKKEFAADPHNKTLRGVKLAGFHERLKKNAGELFGENSKVDDATKEKFWERYKHHGFTSSDKTKNPFFIANALESMSEEDMDKMIKEMEGLIRDGKKKADAIAKEEKEKQDKADASAREASIEAKTTHQVGENLGQKLDTLTALLGTVIAGDKMRVSTQDPTSTVN